MTNNHARLAALLAAIAVAAALRLIHHPPNFSPIDAMALFSGAYVGRRALAFIAPLGALLVSDAVLGFYSGMWANYLAVALVVLLGSLALSRKSALRIGLAAAASAVLFFTMSNFGVWLASGMYGHTLDGLSACYLAGIPFFQNTLAADLAYSALLFGGFALLEDAIPAIRAKREPQPA